MPRFTHLRLSLFAAGLLAALATAAISVSTALAGSGGPPFPR
ncbi:MAG: hypothetical protein ABSG37_12540 [Candidatus Limnocylindrales bacterium]|jgi:hypothetical protein